MDTGTWGLYYNYTWWGNAIQTAPSVIGKPDFFGSQFEMLTSQQPNQVTNGNFATDSDWSKTGTWVISNGQASANANSTSQYIQQDFTISNGKVYKFTYEIIENTLNGSGAALSSFGGFGSVPLNSEIGYHTTYITASNQSATYALQIGVSSTSSSGSITIDNVSIQIVRADNVEAVKCLADWIHETQILDV